jgi:CBS domain-containing protein
MKVRDIMSTDVVTVTKQDNVFEIAQKMKQNDIGFIPVVEGRKLVGVVTDRDLVIRGLAEKRSGSTAVEEVMSTDVVTVTPDMSVDEAAKLMADDKVRRLPVVDNGELVGVVAIGDLAVRNKLEDEAAKALSEISENTDKQYAGVH